MPTSVGSGRIVKGCPRCGADRSVIGYYNCGPIVYLMCPECGFALRESDTQYTGKPLFGDELFRVWNALAAKDNSK